jgi:hypothetical protein
MRGWLKIANGESTPAEVHPLEDHAERNVLAARKLKNGLAARKCGLL